MGDRLEVVPVGCMKLCGFAPLVDVSDETCFQQVMPEVAPEIVDVALGETPSDKLEICDRQAPFFTLQKPVVLENSGKIDPERIEAYIARGGYRSLHQVLEDLTRWRWWKKLPRAAYGAWRRRLSHGIEMGDRRENAGGSKICRL